MNNDLEILKNIVVDVWAHGFMGVDIGKIIIALLIFGIFLFIRGLFSKFVLKYLRNLVTKSTNKLDDKIIDALIPPIKFIPIIDSLYNFLGSSSHMYAFITQP